MQIPESIRTIIGTGPQAQLTTRNDTGHFALETHVEEIALAMHKFLAKVVE